jgi:hypothetical protein
VCTTLPIWSLQCQFFEKDALRKSAFKEELGTIEFELKRAKLAKLVPEDFKDLSAVIYATSFEVVEAMLNLIGLQLTYFGTFAKKVGMKP